MPVERAAALLGVDQDQLAAVFYGLSPVTAEMALRLARLLGNSPDLWLRLQLKHDAARFAAELERIPAHA